MLGMATWLGASILCLVVLATAVVCFLVGRISSKVGVLESQFGNHYHTIQDTTQKMQGDIAAIHGVLSKLDKRTEALHQDIRQFMKDVRDKTA